MRRGARQVTRATVLLVIAGAAIVASCARVVDTSQYVACHADSLQASDDCSTCVETSCCGELGACADDTCAGSAGELYRCVAAGGPRRTVENERACDGGAAPPAALAVYTCSRAHCAAACELSSCTIDPGYPEHKDPTGTCDDCIVGRCCDEVNACYQERSCRLALECVQKCDFRPPVLDGGSGSSMGLNPALIAVAADNACKGVQAEAGAGFGGFKCAEDCIKEYRASACLGLRILSCITSNCPMGCASTLLAADAGAE